MNFLLKYGSHEKFPNIPYTLPFFCPGDTRSLTFYSLLITPCFFNYISIFSICNPSLISIFSGIIVKGVEYVSLPWIEPTTYRFQLRCFAFKLRFQTRCSQNSPHNIICYKRRNSSTNS